MRDYNFYKLELQWPLIATMRPELRLLNLHFFNICRHHPTLKFKPHATDDERYVLGIDGAGLEKSGARVPAGTLSDDPGNKNH